MKVSKLANYEQLLTNKNRVFWAEKYTCWVRQFTIEKISEYALTADLWVQFLENF